MPSLGIAPAPEDCSRYLYTPPQGLAPVSGVFPVGRHVAPSGDWTSGNSAFAISRGSRRLLAPYAWAREPVSMACCCPLSLSRPGQPLDPGISPPIPPYFVGDMSERLVARRSAKNRPGSSSNRRGQAYRPSAPSCAPPSPSRSSVEGPWQLSNYGTTSRLARDRG